MAEANIGAFLLELGAEELPAGQILAISNHIKTAITDALNQAEIKFSSCENLYSPRRLFWYIDGLNLNAQDKEVEIKGPPEKIAKDANGSLSQAALGFAKKNNLEEKNLYFQDGYLYAKQSIKGHNAQALLQEQLPNIIASTPGTRFMRWANGELKFARPLQWIVALIISAKGNTTLDLEIEGLKASSKSRGHRFLAPDEFEVKSRDQYINELEKRGVYIQADKRKAKILEESEKLAETINAKIIPNQSLLDEVIMITENPAPILCEFNSSFLKVPDCVLQTVMIHHQRYIPLERDGKLIPQFIAVSNNPLPQAKANIKAGNEKVIVPRFKDAEFFVDEDSKIKLEDRVAKLEKLNFLKGTMLQKTKRLQKIAQYLINELKPHYQTNPARKEGDSLDDEDSILKSALLCKADLSTNLVFEFTELQGEIGGVYAEKQGLNNIVSKAIAEHYRPRFTGDNEPVTIAGKILSIADKIDNIVCAFALGKIPSGSADPFALRRQANGMLEVIIHGHLLLNIENLVDYVIKLQKEEFGDGDIVTKIRGRGEDRKEVQVAELNWQDCDRQVKEFLESRLLFVFELCHKDTQVNKAVLTRSRPLSAINKSHMMIHLVYNTKADQQFSKFVESVTRITNIAKIEANIDRAKLLKEIDSKLFEGEYEQRFFDAIKPLDVNGAQDLHYTPILSKDDLLGAVNPINSFFDNVLVNAENEKIKANRKALVAYASSVFGEIGDFTQL